MRGAGLCTVSGPLAACSTASGAPLPAGARFLALHLLAPPTPASRECSTTQQTLYFIVEVKSRVKEVFAQTCLHFSQQGMVDTDLFGLAIICDGEYLFAEPESKLSKYAPKSWRSSHTHGLDANGRPALAFYFRVQFFVDSPLLLRDESTRHHYYLQLRHNAATRGSEQAVVLAGLALQADYGDRVDSTSPGYFRPEDYVPPSLRTPWGVQAIENNHRDNRGLSKPEAELQYVREACNLQEPINAHVFRLRGNKNESLPGSITLAVCAQGIKVFPDNNPASTFLWGSIGKLSFERKKFEIRTGHEKLTLYTSSDEKSKLLLSLCRDTHQFSMAMAPRLTEAKKQEEEQRRCLRDCYLYSRIPCKSGRLDQRVSVISSTSSNTTSGIVSDRVHSEDELEIMITCPPAPSTESLALAHLIDSNPVSRQSSSASAQEKLIADALKISQTDVLSNCSRSSSSSSEPISSKDITSKQTDTDSCISTKTTTKCAGSQCSSSCSTVVVATTTKTGRRPSTSSSLELGYSHTAQNSSVSDATCIEIDTRETSSGVYTLGNTNTVSSQTSGIYTMDSSEMTSNLSNGDSQNDYAGQIDQVDGTDTFRDRSNSNISNSGSFRGDGSDPTDTKQTLLSAEELSDLIVGRGVYPSRKTVSHTLDSDSDYVTLPSNYQGFAPIPPKRVDSNQVTNLNNSLLGIVGNSISSETCDSMLHFRPPPPYNAHHETISKSISTEPSVTDFDEISVSCLSDEIPILTRDPPPYPYPATVTTPIPPPIYPSEEVSARFIKTRPHINVLTAHTSTVLTPNTNYPSNSESIPKSTIQHKPDVPPIPPKHASTLSKSKPHFYPSNDALTNLKSVAALPVTALIAPNNYLDVAASKASVLVPYTFLPPPPPPPIPRQPPPPPPSNLATVYTSQLSRSQIEQYQQQMYSDVDFVVFPLKEPALSKQEYLEAKQGSLLAALAQSPPPYPLYRSTPYLNVPRYASTQNLSDTYVHLPIYSAASLSSTGSLEPPPPLPPNRTQLGRFRAKSDDNILNSLDMPQKPKFRRLPPPPPPIFSLPNDKLRRNEIKSNEITAKDILRSQQIASDISVKEKLLRSQPNLHSVETQSSIRQMKSNINLSNVNSFSSPVKRSQLNSCSMSSLVSAQLSAKKPQINNSNSNSCSMSSTAMNIPPEIPVPSSQSSKTSNSGVIDIRTLLEKSKNLDLPLISALCNDRSLLKQTKAFVMPKHPDAPVRSPSITTTKLKYPVSGLSSTQISKPVRKTVSSHRHPNDKLPEIPRAAPNTYVVTDSKGKHKTMQSHS